MHRLDEVVDAFGEDILIVIAFASQRPEVLDKMYALDRRFDVVAPDVPVVEGAVFDEAFVCAHSGEMERAYALLADERSRTVFLDTVRFKLSGRLCYLCASETDKDEVFRTVLRLGPEQLSQAVRLRGRTAYGGYNAGTGGRMVGGYGPVLFGPGGATVAHLACGQGNKDARAGHRAARQAMHLFENGCGGRGAGGAARRGADHPKLAAQAQPCSLP